MTAPKKPRSGPGSRTGAAARSGPSGPSIPEAARGTKRTTLRLTPEAHAMLANLCGRWECGPSEAVTSLLKAEAIDLATLRRLALDAVNAVGLCPCTDPDGDCAKIRALSDALPPEAP